MIDLSIVIPAIRPHRWAGVYESIQKSCTRYSFEIIFVGPYPPPEELKDNPQIKYIEDWGGSSRSAQIGLGQASGRLLIRGDYDGHFFEGAIDQCIDLLDSKANKKDGVALRYREGRDFKGKPMAEGYWYARFHFPYRHELLKLIVQNVKKHGGRPHFESLHLGHDYVVCMNVLTDREYAVNLGGFDCSFEHLGFANHDFCYRIQRDGGIIHLSPVEAINVDFEKGNDHRPIEKCHVQMDFPRFIKMYQDPDVVNRIKIDFDNWKQSPAVWTRRFPEGKVK